jgi:spore germination protein KA
MGMAVRLVRFLFILLGVTLGLVGLATGLFVLIGVLCYMKSFGIPYMSPLGAKTTPGLDTIMQGPVYRQERRPDELNTLNQRRQPPISRKWSIDQPEGDPTDEL